MRVRTPVRRLLLALATVFMLVSVTPGTAHAAAGIDVQITPATQTVEAGFGTRFEVTITNTGDVDFDSGVVLDSTSIDCGPGPASLGAGAVLVLSCYSDGAVTADFTASMTVTATHPDGVATDTATAEVTVGDPPTTGSYTVLQDTVPSGPQDFAYSVTEPSASFNFILDDDPGDSTRADNYTRNSRPPGTYTVTQTAVPNFPVSISCDDPDGETTTSGGTATIDVDAGEDIICTFTNTDSMDIRVVKYNDLDGNGTNNEINFSPGGSSGNTLEGWTFTLYDGTGAELDQGVTSVESPGSGDLGIRYTFQDLPKAATYTICETEQAGFTNTEPGAATATDPTGAGRPCKTFDTTNLGTLGFSYFGNVAVTPPSITITKTPEYRVVESGGTATFDFTITNSGDIDLTDIEVVDANAPACDRSFEGPLGSEGPPITYSCQVDNIEEGFVNTASVTADVVGSDAPVSDTSDDAVVEVANVEITKTPASQTVVSGGTASFTITVTNTGEVPLRDIEVTDALAPDCERVISDSGAGDSPLVPGESASYSCEVTNVTADFTNIATVTADSPLGADTVTDTSEGAEVVVEAPLELAVQIIKTPASQTILSGGTAAFTITVTNTGDFPLRDIEVSDALAPDCERPDLVVDVLAPGGSSSYDCELTDVTADFTNVASVDAQNAVDATDVPTSVQDTSEGAFVDVIDPAITISKTPATQTINSGGTATFDITITNTGDAVLSNVEILDALAPDCERTFLDNFAPGDPAITYTCEVSGVTDGFTNLASVQADVNGVDASVNDSSEGAVVVVTPGTMTTTTTSTTTTEPPAISTTTTTTAVDPTTTTAIDLPATSPPTTPSDPGAVSGADANAGTVRPGSNGSAGVSGGSTGVGQGTLPRTGSSVVGLLSTSVALIIGGAWFVRRGVRRRTHA